MAQTPAPPSMYVINEVVFEAAPVGPYDARFEAAIRRTLTISVADLPPAVRDRLDELMRKNSTA